MKALNCMIPECTYLYWVEAAQRWFSNAGLLAYQDVKWDPTKQSTTTSHQDQETKALVNEDLFQIGTNWVLAAPIMQAQATRQAPQPDTRLYGTESTRLSWPRK
jgi:CCR4-NOT transcriptional regulation complex NOT5 subunit